MSTGTATGTATEMPTQTVTATEVPTEIPTEMPAEVPPVDTPLPLDTPAAVFTATLVPSDTPLPTDTPVFIPEPSATPAPTETSTILPPDLPTETVIPTLTPIDRPTEILIPTVGLESDIQSTIEVSNTAILSSTKPPIGASNLITDTLLSPDTTETVSDISQVQSPLETPTATHTEFPTAIATNTLLPTATLVPPTIIPPTSTSFPTPLPTPSPISLPTDTPYPDVAAPIIAATSRRSDTITYIMISITVVVPPTPAPMPTLQPLTFTEATPIPGIMQRSAQTFDSALIVMSGLWLMVGLFIFFVVAGLLIGLVIYTQHNERYRLSYRRPDPDWDPIIYPAHMLTSYQRKRRPTVIQVSDQGQLNAQNKVAPNRAFYMDDDDYGDEYWPSALP